MNIKMIAVDMDGTFLNREGTYNKKRFQEMYKEFKKREIKFVVASGNPYKQLLLSFDDIKNELVFIADNGGYIIEKGEDIYLSNIDKKNATAIINALKEMPDVLCWVCTKNQSYTLESISDHFFEMFLPYFPGVKKVQDFSLIHDDILKFALYMPEQNTDARIIDLMNIVSKDIRVVDSGHDCVDIIPSHVNKGVALECLMKRYHLHKDEVMAFGDAGNDEDMLKAITYGYVMENAKPEFKSKFDYVAPSNDNEGVLAVVEQYMHDATFINLK